MARRDVDLVIRAHDEAKSALDAINQTLDKFIGTQRETQNEAQRTDSQIERLGSAIANLQNNLKGLTIAGTIAQELERARIAMERVEVSTAAAAGEAIGYRREAGNAARATAKLRGESERLNSNIAEQEMQVSRARMAYKNLQTATTNGARAQERYSLHQEKLGRQITQQERNLTNYRARFKELQIAITQVVKPTARLSQDFKRAANNIQRTETRIAELTETQRLITTETDRASRSVERANILYGSQAASLGQAKTILAGFKQEQKQMAMALRAATREQVRFETSADKSTIALRSQDQALERAAENYRGVRIAANQTEAALFGLEEQIRGKLLRAFGEQRARLKATEQSFAANSQEAQHLAQELRQTQAPTRELQAAFDAYRAAAARGRQEIREQQRVLAELRSVLREGTGDVDSFANRQKRFASAIERARRSFTGYESASIAAATASERLARSEQHATLATNRQVRSTNNLSRATSRATRNQGLFANAIRKVYGENRVALSFTQRLRSEVLSLIAAYGGFFAIINLIHKTVNSIRTLESATNRLNVVFSGNKMAVANELDFIRRNAERLGIEFGTLAQEYTKFAVATQNTNLEGAETRRIFVSVAEAARVNNLTLDQLEGTFVALTQIVSKGTLSMEELRQQLGDRLPGAIQIMAAGLGRNTAELVKMISQGKISSDSLSDFADELDRRFGKQLPSALNTTNAALGRFQNTVFQAFLRIGKSGTIQGFTNLLRDLTDTLNSAQFQDFADRIGVVLGKLFDIIGMVVTNFNLLIIAVTSFIGLKIAPFIVAIITILRRLPAIIRLNQIRFASFRASMIATTGTLTGTAAAVTRLRIALSLLMSSTGIGLLVTLIGTGIGIWITQTKGATEALIQHKKMLDQVRNTYDKVGDSVAIWRANLENLTITQARSNLKALQKQLHNLQQEFEHIFPLNPMGKGAFNMGPGFFREMDKLFNQFSKGTIQADDFLKSVNALNEQFRDSSDFNAKYATRFDEVAQAIVHTTNNIKESQLVIVALTGSEEKAAKALKQLSGQIEETSSSTETGAERLKNYRGAMEKLRGLVPNVANEIKQMEEQAKLEDALRATLKYADSWKQVSAAFKLFEQGLNEADLTSFISNLSGVGGGMTGLAAQIIRGFRKFRETPYLDRNILRVGYGSDTITLSDGTIQAVTEGMRITRADADRDLVRRITQEFVPAIRNAIGTERFNGLDARQQAVLVSLAHSFGANAFNDKGALAGVAQAVREGSIKGVAQAIRDLGSSPFNPASESGRNLINRRNREAGLFESGGIIDESGFVAAQEKAIQLTKTETEARKQARLATLGTIKNLKTQIAQQKLINSGHEREATIQAAISAARKENINITDTEIAQITKQTGHLFDLENAERSRNLQKEYAIKAEERVNQLLSLRQQLEGELATAQTSNASEDAINGIQTQISKVNNLLEKAIQNALDFAIAMGSTDPEIETLISRLRQLKFEGVDGANQIKITYDQVQNTLSGSLVNAANTFAQSLANGKNIAKSLGDAFRQFAADFLRQISQMILKQLAFNAAQGILQAVGFAAAGAIVLHSGGIVGAEGVARSVDASAFLNAVRYHSGGITGLQSGEVPAILQRGEEVLTENDPRHIFNNGKTGDGQNPGTRIKIINAVDGGQVISEGLNTATGEEAILNFIRSNAFSIRSAIEIEK